MLQGMHSEIREECGMRGAECEVQVRSVECAECAECAEYGAQSVWCGARRTECVMRKCGGWSAECGAQSDVL